MHKFVCFLTFLTLAGCVATPIKEEPRFTDDTPHKILRDKHRCVFNAPSALVKRMNSYLQEKNSSKDSSLFSKKAYEIESKLVDDYVSPSYLKKHSVAKNTAHHNDYGGADEITLCIAPDGVEKYRVVTAISQVPNGWTKVMEYKMIEEDEQFYFLPPNTPTATDVDSNKVQFHYTGMTQQWWIRTIEVVEEFQL